MAYVYFLKNKTTNIKYIGVKYSKNNCEEKLFWKTYFTSSKHIHKLIEIYGKKDFVYKILKSFDNEYDALVYENNLNRCAVGRYDYLNLHYNFIGNLTEDEYLFNKEKQRKIASFYGKLTYLIKIGIHKYSKEERMEICSKAGISAGMINKSLGRAIFDPEVRKRQHITLKEKQVSAYYNPKLRKEICSKAGKLGYFSKEWYIKNNVSEKIRIQKQSDRGRIGGKRNKGFIYYNDAVNTYKYTLKQQQNMNFVEFLKQNPQFFEGRLFSATKNKIWVNDGVKNYLLYKDHFDKNIYNIGRLGNKDKYNGHKNKKNNKNKPV